MVALLVVIAALFVWRAFSKFYAVSKISESGKSNGLVIEGDSVNVEPTENPTRYKEAVSNSSNIKYPYYGLFLAD